MRHVSLDNRVAEEFNGDLNVFQFPNSYLIPSDSWHPSLRCRPNPEIQCAIQERIKQEAILIYGWLDHEHVECGHQFLQMKFTRIGQAVFIDSQVVGQFKTGYSIKELTDALTYNEMCLYKSEAINRTQYFVPLTEYDKAIILKHMQELLESQARTALVIERLQRMLNESAIFCKRGDE